MRLLPLDFCWFPCDIDSIVDRHRSVICIRPDERRTGLLSMSYTEAFTLGFAGLIDLNRPISIAKQEIVASIKLNEKIQKQGQTGTSPGLLLAEKYMKIACQESDYECIYAVGRYLMDLPSVQSKTAIFRDIRCLCDQIECTAFCSNIDAKLALLELNQHVFVDVA